MSVLASVGIYDYNRKKLCDLYDSQSDLSGQAYQITWTQNINGVDALNFKLPYMIDGEKNFRWQYMKSDYLLRLFYDGKAHWFVGSKPKKSRSGKEITGDVECNGTPILLKTKKIYQIFDDTNGIGTVQYLIGQVLKGTGWRIGDATAAMKIYEKDGVTEKVRSLNVTNKSGALQLITTVCNLFHCRPEFDTDTMTLELYPMKEREQVLEGEVGRNLSAITAASNGEDIVTRLYVEGEYSDDGYVGIDDVNPTGLNYLFNFDYFREIGTFTAEHETALNDYLRDITAVNQSIRDLMVTITDLEGDMNDLVGQCKMAVYYKSKGYTEPKWTYGDPGAGQAKLYEADEVIIVNSDGTYRYETLGSNPASSMESGDFAIVKFVTKSAGSFGAKEVAVEAKQKTIEDLQKKIDSTTSEDKKEEYRAEIAQLEDEIDQMYNDVTEKDGKAVKLKMAKTYIPTDYNGNADLTDRILIPGSRMRTAGYDFSDEDYATIYSHTFTAGVDEGADWPYRKNVVIDITPIRKTGAVLTHQELEDYLEGIINASTTSGRSLLECDNDSLKLILRVYEMAKGESFDTAIYKSDRWTYSLHLLQAQWDQVRAKYDWFKKTDRDPGGYMNYIRGIHYHGLYKLMYSMVKSDGILYQLDRANSTLEPLQERQDEVEADFIIAMGDMLRDGYWANNNYIVGQEEHLFADAQEMSEQMGKPATSYTLSYIRVMEEFGIPMEDIRMNAVFRIHDEELEVHENLFINQIVIGIDDESKGSISVSNQDLTLQSASLSGILSRMSQLADLIDQKNQLYERAKSFSREGSLYTQRLEGQIDVLRTQFLSTVSHWYTDENGNIIFEAADGSSAMMLCGAGFMIASEKDEDGEFLWRTFGTGHGFTADEIVAGFISAERIEAGSIATEKLEADAGQKLVISNNPTVLKLNEQIAPPFDETKNYKKGDYCSYGGQFYVFTSDHTAGPWNWDHVSPTNVGSEITLLPDRIISEVKRISHVFVQLTDPCLDADKQIIVGDIWIIPNGLGSWYDPEQWEVKWEDFLETTWGECFTDINKTYCWDGEKWIDINNSDALSIAYTRITQTADMIQSEAYRANAAEGVLRSTITQTATEIEMKVENEKNNIYSRIDQTASSITTEVIAGNESLWSRVEQTASSIRSEVAAGDSSIHSVIDQTASSITMEVGKKSRNFVQATDPALVASNNVKDGDIWTIPGIDDNTWGGFRDNEIPWQTLRGFIWGDIFTQINKTYIRDNGAWRKLNDDEIVNEAYTRIMQTQDQILLEAYRANEEEGRLRSSISQTATDITMLVENEKYGLESRIEQTASSIRTEVRNDKESLSTTIEQTASSIRTEASVTTGSITSRIDSGFTSMKTYIDQTASGISLVAESKNAVYRQWDDPCLDPDKRVRVGDMWYKIEDDDNDKPWNWVKRRNWQYFIDKNYKWKRFFGGEMYVFGDDGEWHLTSDYGLQISNSASLKVESDRITSEVARLEGEQVITRSQFEQTAEGFRMEVENVNANVQSTIEQTADSIKAEVKAEVTQNISTQIVETFNSCIEQTASSIRTEVVQSLSGPSGEWYIARSGRYQSARDIVDVAEEEIQNDLGQNYYNRTQIDQTASSITQTAKSYVDGQLSSYSTIEQTAAAINMKVKDYYGKKSGIEIEAEGITIDGSKYVRINSGGYFWVDSGNENGGFGVQSNSSSYVMWAGKNRAHRDSAPFRLTPDGKLYCTQLIVSDPDHPGQEKTVDLYSDFYNATRVSLTTGWGGNALTARAYKGSRVVDTKQNSMTDIIVSDNITIRNKYYVDTKAHANFDGDAGSYSSNAVDVSINAEGVFNNGYNEALSDAGVSNGGTVYTGTVKQVYDPTLDVWFNAVCNYTAHTLAKKS